jgi:predicted DsbA family dithiol-disulfide isomerase
MSTHLKIDFVSDISCPWCVVGLRALDLALARVSPDISATLHFQPFELNPTMGPEGQDITEHITQKYGISAAPTQTVAGAAALTTPLTRIACCIGRTR